MIANAPRPWLSLGWNLGRTLFFAALGPVLAGASPPDWLLADARLGPAPQGPEVPAIILRDEVTFAVDAHGEWTETRRYSVRLLTRSGEAHAAGKIDYVDKADDVTRTHAWLIRDGKERKAYGRREWADMAQLADEVLYTDFRLKVVSASAEAQPGDVFGYETVVKRRSNAGQAIEWFGGYLPVLYGRVAFRVPPGGEPTAFWLNRDAVPPEVSADRTAWTWTLRNLPFQPSESWMPGKPGIRVAFSVTPPAGTKGGGAPSLATWADVAKWTSALQQPQCDSSPALTATARRLVKDAADEWGRIAAIGAFVQERHYASTDRNTGLGFGYQPHKATAVLASNYGDCKDKANLMCALLREVGIRAFSVVVFAGNANAVRPEWPSPSQFNHAIIGIVVSAAVECPAVKEVAGFGRLLFFDPTNRWVPFGRLSWVLQGSRGLIVDPTAADLVELPNPQEADLWLSAGTTRLSIGANGQLNGHSQIVLGGELATHQRGSCHEQTDKELKDGWARNLNRTIRGVVVSQVKTADDRLGNRFETQLEFTAPSFGQLVKNELLLVQLGVLNRGSVPAFSEKTRRHPLLLRPIDDRDDVTFVIPAGFVVDELPPRKELKSDYGEYSGEFTQADGAVVYRRALTLRLQRVSPEDYPKLRSFLIEVARAEHATAVLRAKQ